MNDQAATPAWWRIVHLRLRARTGWGLEEPNLRQWARFYKLQTNAILTMIVIFPAIFVVIYNYNLLPRFGFGGVHPKPIPLILHASVPLIGIFLLLAAFSVSMSVLHSLRAKAGESQPLVTCDGYCFAVASVPSSFLLFALIGATHEMAHWFCLPIFWDTTIKPGDDRFELTYNSVTGFVEQVKRTGAESRTLTRPPENQVEQGEASLSDEDTCEATPAQRREMMQLLRQSGAHWGASTRSMLALGLTMLFMSVFYEIAPIVMIGTTRAYPGHSEPADFHTLVIVGLILAAVGIVCFIYGVHIMRVWARFRRSDALALTILLGDQICWTPKGSRQGTAGDYLALVQLASGVRVVFRIPRKWRHPSMARRKPRARDL